MVNEGITDFFNCFICNKKIYAGSTEYIGREESGLVNYFCSEECKDKHTQLCNDMAGLVEKLRAAGYNSKKVLLELINNVIKNHDRRNKTT